MSCAACGMSDHRYGTSDTEHEPDRMACINMLRAEAERLARALSGTADLLYEVWRCNDDDERRALGHRVGEALGLYAMHPSHLVGFPMPAGRDAPRTTTASSSTHNASSGVVPSTPTPGGET